MGRANRRPLPIVTAQRERVMKARLELCLSIVGLAVFGGSFAVGGLSLEGRCAFAFLSISALLAAQNAWSRLPDHTDDKGADGYRC